MSKLSGVRQSKIIKQGASGRNELTYTTKKNISKLTCLPVLFWLVCRSPCLLVLFWWVCLSPSACGRGAFIHLKVNYRYKRVQMVHILNKYVEYQCTVIPTLSPWQVMWNIYIQNKLTNKYNLILKALHYTKENNNMASLYTEFSRRPGN
jgi:hypothetical protein